LREEKRGKRKKCNVMTGSRSLSLFLSFFPPPLSLSLFPKLYQYGIREIVLE